MPYFRSPKVLFGRDILRRLGNEIKGRGEKAVIITGKVGAKLCGKLVDEVKNAGYEVKIWDGVEPEPSLEIAHAGGKILLDYEPQLVIGFGGGSAIDTAKAAWLLYERPDLAGTELDKTAGVRAILNLRKKARFMAVPTTSGTGSDVTWAIVLTDTVKNRKIAFANENGAFLADLDGDKLAHRVKLDKDYRIAAGRPDVTEMDGASIESYAMKPTKYLMPIVDNWRELLAPFKFFLPNGGPYGFADVAEGKIDCYFAPRQPYVDIFSGIYIAQQAGAVVTDFDGNPVKPTDDVKTLWDVVASTNPKIHEQIIDAIAKCRKERK